MAMSGTLDPRCAKLDLPERVYANMVRLDDGSILTVVDNTMLVSEDNGKSWCERGPVYTGPPPGVPGGGMLLRTQNDWIVMVYADSASFIWNWNDETRSADRNAKLDVWAIRSPDGGKTWLDRQRIMEGYCGALITMIELDRGGIVVPVQIFLRDPDRHAMTAYRSEDDGLTWSHANIIDMGGNGHHDGAMEATVAELTNGSLLMLIRTNFDYLWESISTDQGRYWRVLQKTSIDASSAPAYLLRLASGRLCLAWNRLQASDGSPPPRRSGQYSEAEASWFRDELSIAFSEDEAQTWSEPQVVATDSERPHPCYPTMFEPSPGLIWVTAGSMKFSLKEADFTG